MSESQENEVKPRYKRGVGDKNEVQRDKRKCIYMAKFDSLRHQCTKV